MSAPQFPLPSSEKCVTEKWIQTAIPSLLFFSAVQIFWKWEDLDFTFTLFLRSKLSYWKKKKNPHAESEPGKFSPLCLFLCCAERLIGFADGLSPQ